MLAVSARVLESGPSEAWVYLHLCRMAGGRSEIEASCREIARAAGISERNVRRLLANLEAKRVIMVEAQLRPSGGHERKLYHLQGGKPMAKRKPAKPKSDADPRAIPPFPEALDTPEFRAAVERFVATRAKLGHRQWLTETWQINLRKWATWGADRAAAALHHSCDNEYQGVFEPKSGQRPQPGIAAPPPPPSAEDAAFDQEAGDVGKLVGKLLRESKESAEAVHLGRLLAAAERKRDAAGLRTVRAGVERLLG